MPTTLPRILRIQGAYYAATGAWPLLHLPSFEAVTGPKHDRWLVRTVGLLAAVTGASLLSAAARREAAPPILALAAGSAAAFAGVDAWYSLRGRISKVYLLDAALEISLLTALLLLLRRARGGPGG